MRKFKLLENTVGSKATDLCKLLSYILNMFNEYVGKPTYELVQDNNGISNAEKTFGISTAVSYFGTLKNF